MGKLIHWELCKRLTFDHTDKWYIHKPESVLENDMHKIHWNFEILLYHAKEEIHSEIKLTIYQLKWYSPTNIISLALWVLHPNLVLLLTEIFQYWLYIWNMMSFIPQRYRKSCGMSHYTTDTNSSCNSSQKTRLSINKQKEKNLWI